MEFALALVIIAVPLWLNVKATRLVVGNVLLEHGQKVAQLLFIWLVPLIGAVLVLAVHRPAEPSSGRYRESVEPGDDFALSGRTVKSNREAPDGED